MEMTFRRADINDTELLADARLKYLGTEHETIAEYTCLCSKISKYLRT